MMDNFTIETQIPGNKFTGYTKAELDMLLMLRKRPRTWEYVIKRIRPNPEKPKEAMSMMLSNCHELIKNENGSYWSEKLELNQKGVTVAQAEFDRRFDMYYTRIISIIALACSIVAIVITAV